MTAIPHGISPLTAIAIAIRQIREMTQLDHEQLTNDLCHQLAVQGHGSGLLPEDDTAEVIAVRAHLGRIAAHLEQALRLLDGPDLFAVAERGVTGRLDDGWAEHPADLTAVTA